LTASVLAKCLVFLVPGAFAAGSGGAAHFITGDQYFAEYKTFFEAKGCKTSMASFAPDATIEERALMLRDQLERFRKANGEGIVLIAHSQGGLDARFALKHLKIRGVRALVTIGVPHHGTPVADWVIDQRDHERAYFRILRLVGYDLSALRFVGELSPAFLQKHAEHFQEVPGIRYASAEAVCTSHCYWGLRALRSFMGLGPSDGLVAAESQRFGEDLGTYDLDHLSEVGVDSEKRAERQKFLGRVWAWAFGS
jgi:triacylglycerol lipase